MAGSLLDIGKIAQLGQLAESQRRNDIYEQNSLLQAEQNQIDEARIKESTRTREANFFLKLADDPRAQANPEIGDRALAKAWELSNGPPLPDETFQEMLKVGRNDMRESLKAMYGGDREAAMNAMGNLQVKLGSDAASKLASGLSTVEKLGEQAASIQAYTAFNRAKQEKIHNAESKIRAGSEPYGQAVREFGSILHGTDHPEFMRVAKNAAKVHTKDEADMRTVIAGLAKGVPAAGRFGAPQYAQAAQAYNKIATSGLDMLNQAQQTINLAKQGEPLPPNTTERDLLERIETGRTLIDAYGTLSTWANDPYNLPKLKEAKSAQSMIVKKRAELESLKASTAQENLDLRREAQTFRETEAGKKQLYSTAIGQAQSEVLERFGRTPADKDLASVARKYGVQPAEVLPGLADPSKKGRLEVGIKLGQEDVSRNLKMIESAQGVIDFTNDLRDLVKKNPAIVGKGAQLGTALAGAGQQLRAIGRLDPEGAKFLNTKTRDSAESFYEILVYLQARSMDPVGVLDIKVVQHAREVLGDLNALTTGPSQFLNKLEVVTGNAERNLRRARRTLRGGIGTALTDENIDKPIGQMTEEELLKAILQGAGQ